MSPRVSRARAQSDALSVSSDTLLPMPPTTLTPTDTSTLGIMNRPADGHVTLYLSLTHSRAKVGRVFGAFIESDGANSNDLQHLYEVCFTKVAITEASRSREEVRARTRSGDGKNVLAAEPGGSSKVAHKGNVCLCRALKGAVQ